ncbi:MAG: hypothetical protein OCD02_00555 [Spirochaetaceae bacterium]
MNNILTWNANWIGVDNKKDANQWICFRKNIQLDSVPKLVTAKIAADSKYWLWINGKLVVFEGQLKRGPDPENTYYDNIDLTAYLQEGDNCIAVLLWHFGKHGFSHNSSGQAGLIFEANLGDYTLSSGADWKVLRHPAFFNTKKPHPNYRLPESNILFDSRKDIQGWQSNSYDDSSWSTATEFGKPTCAPWNKLIPRPIPQWKDFGLKEYTQTSIRKNLLLGESVFTCALEYNAQITPYLKVKATKGKKIAISTDNYKGGGAFNVRAEYITKNGIQEFECLGWMNGHNVIYKIPKGVEVLSLQYRETGYNCEFRGTFECDDDFVNRYREKALRTLYITMRDTYMDCPDRERAQWWGDAVNELGEAFYALDFKSSLLAKKGIKELFGWQKEDGSIFSPVPAGNYSDELPMQMLNSVGFYGIWTYYQHSGDLETLTEVYPGIKTYLSLWETDSNGLVIPRKGGWLWGDWGNHKDMNLLFNLWYYLALKGQYNMAKVLGHQDDVINIKLIMDGIKKSFNTTFWTGTCYRSKDYKGKTDDRVHALAVLAELAEPDKYRDIQNVFETSYHSSAYMEKYVAEAQYVMGYEAEAIIRLKKRFSFMVDHKLTTLWEDWKIGGSGGGTTNHGWSGGFLTLLSQYGLGVAPSSPGYTSYDVLPQIGSLKKLKGVIPSVKGDIRVRIEDKKGEFSLFLVSPLDTIAKVGIPIDKVRNISDIKVNGVSVSDENSGVKFLEKTERYNLFSVNPGSWEFIGKTT